LRKLSRKSRLNGHFWNGKNELWIVLSAASKKKLVSLPKSRYIAVLKAIDSLTSNPRPLGCKKLVDREGWRIHVGVYRVIYKIDDSQQTVTVTDIGHRSDVY